MTNHRITNDEINRLLGIIEKPADQLTTNDQLTGFARALMVTHGTGYTAEQKAKCQRVADYLSKVRRERSAIAVAALRAGGAA